MLNGTARGNVRAMSIAFGVACLFVTFSRTSAQSQSTPAAANTPVGAVAAPTAAGTPATAVAATPAGAVAATPVATPAVSASPTVSAAKRALCERYAAALAGRAEDQALLDKAEVKALARKIPDLPACHAVVQDSDAPCNLLGDRDAILRCRTARAVIHELKKPQGRSYLFTDVEYERCKGSKEMAPMCDRLRAAFRSGDPDKCPKEVPSCRAFMMLDPSLCHGEGPDPKADAEACKVDLSHRVIFAKGLEGMAKSDSPFWRPLAQAALGQKDACKALEPSTVEICLGKETAAAPQTPGTAGATPAAPAPVAATPVSGTPSGAKPASAETPRAP